MNAKFFTFAAETSTQNAEISTPGEILGIFMNHTTGSVTVTVNVVVVGVVHQVWTDASPADQFAAATGATVVPPGGYLQVVSSGDWTGTVLVALKSS